jgi:hypothetical protein
LVFVLMVSLMNHFISREIVREGVGHLRSYRKSTESLARYTKIRINY